MRLGRHGFVRQNDDQLRRAVERVDLLAHRRGVELFQLIAVCLSITQPRSHISEPVELYDCFQDAPSTIIKDTRYLI